MSLRSPLGAALGRGSAGDGVTHWRSQRLSALALVPLSLWFLVALIRLPLNDYAAVTIWMASGWNPVWLSLLLVVTTWHARLGVQVVIEDYVHAPGPKAAALVVNAGLNLVLLAAGLYAVLRMALRGAA